MSQLPSELVDYQLSIAEYWIERALSVRRAKNLKYTADFEFVAYFAAFNSLYWLHSLVVTPEKFTEEDRHQVESALVAADVSESLRSKVLEKLQSTLREEKQIEHLVGILPGEFAARMLETHQGYVEYLDERGTVRRMGKRTLKRFVGEEKDGAKHLNCLRDGTRAAGERLQAMAGILYLIRCNLFHGSKGDEGTDQKLLEHSVAPLGDIAMEALNLTKRLLP
jgi:hypothetical protein